MQADMLIQIHLRETRDIVTQIKNLSETRLMKHNLTLVRF